MQASQQDLPKIIEDIITNNEMIYEIQMNVEKIGEVVRKFPVQFLHLKPVYLLNKKSVV